MNASNSNNILKNDILIISYYLDKNSWESASKTSFQRVLYFAATLSPIFIPDEKWTYDFSNTLFGPYNNEISKIIQEINIKGFLNLDRRNIYKNRIEERYNISKSGVKICEEILFKLVNIKSKCEWFDIITKTLSIYGEDFLSKLIKKDPNVMNLTMLNSYKKITIDNSEDNISKEFFNFIKQKGTERLNLEKKNDKDVLLLFFDILYRKYKGDR